MTSPNDRFGPENMGFVLVSEDDQGDEVETELEDGQGFTPEEAARFLAGQMRLVRRNAPDVNPNPNLLAAGTPNMDSNTGETHTGAMIALVPSDADLERLADAGTEGYDQIHLTMFYLGKADEINLLQQTAIVERVREITLSWATMAVTGFGAAIWNPDGDTPALIMNVGGCDCLEMVHEAFEEMLEDIMFECPEQHEPWVAHICLAYGSVPELLGMMPAALNEVGEIVFDKVRVAFGPQVIDIPLVYSETDTTMME